MARVPVFPMRIGREAAQGIANREIYDGLWRPDDISIAQTSAATLEQVPLWRMAVETSGFHIGLGAPMYRGRVMMPGPAVGVRHDAFNVIIIAHRHFPRAYLPVAGVAVEPKAIVDVDSSGLEGTLLPVDVHQTEAEREAIGIAMRRISPNIALYANYIPQISTFFAYYPLWIVRYAYRGMGSRYQGEEFFVSICGRSGRIIASHHPTGGGLFGAVGRFFGGRPAVPHQPPQPYQPPPRPPPPQPAYVPPPPRSRRQGTVQPEAGQLLAIKPAVSLSDARTTIGTHLDVPEGARPLLVHVPFYRLRSNERLRPRTRSQAPCVFASQDGFVYLVAAFDDAALAKDVDPLAELGGFHAPEVAAANIAVTDKKTLEAGAMLVSPNVPPEESLEILKATLGVDALDLASKRLVFVPLYIQKVDRGYVVVDGVSGAVLGKRAGMITALENEPFAA